jgi:hypothetical protein
MTSVERACAERRITKRAVSVRGVRIRHSKSSRINKSAYRYSPTHAEICLFIPSHPGGTMFARGGRQRWILPGERGARFLLPRLELHG